MLLVLWKRCATPLEVLGVPAAGFVLNTLFGNFRHSNLFLRFPQVYRKVVSITCSASDSSQYRRAHWNKNFGTWLSIWDRMSGSLLVSETKPKGFGLETPNHDQGLISALIRPLHLTHHEMVPVVMIGLLMFSAVGHAEEPTEEEEV